MQQRAARSEAAERAYSVDREVERDLAAAVAALRAVPVDARAPPRRGPGGSRPGLLCPTGRHRAPAHLEEILVVPVLAFCVALDSMERSAGAAARGVNRSSTPN
jgi:hypothetical protein